MKRKIGIKLKNYDVVFNETDDDNNNNKNNDNN